MASAETNVNLSASPASAAQGLLVSLPPLPQEAFELAVGNLALAFPGEPVLVATPDISSQSSGSPLRLLSYNPTTVSATPWILTAADYLNAYKIAQETRSTACLVLGAEAQSLSPEAIRALADSALQSDLTLARYDLGPREGLVNAAILYPVTRALFGTRPRFPLAIDVGLSLKMAGRLAAAAHVLPPLARTMQSYGLSTKLQPPTARSRKSASPPVRFLIPSQPISMHSGSGRRFLIRRCRSQSQLLATRPWHPTPTAFHHPPRRRVAHRHRLHARCLPARL